MALSPEQKAANYFARHANSYSFKPGEMGYYIGGMSPEIQHAMVEAAMTVLNGVNIDRLMGLDTGHNGQDVAIAQRLFGDGNA